MIALLITLIGWVFQIYFLIIIAQVAVSWLIMFDIINPNHPQSQNLIALLRKCTEPLYRPLRKFIPPIGGIDITPIIVILGLSLLERFIIQLLISIS